MQKGRIEQMSSPSDILAKQANEFVREFIGIERIAQKRKVSMKQLKEFQAIFDKETSKRVQSVPSTMTTKQATNLLKKDDTIHLEVMEDGRVLGYLGYHTLLEAAIKGGKVHE